MNAGHEITVKVLREILLELGGGLWGRKVYNNCD